MPNVVTIREAVERAKAEGLPISEYALRHWVRTGVVPVRKIGQKALLYYPNLVKYLQCTETENIHSAIVPAAPGIRRVEL